MISIPAIDLIGGKLVRLEKGDYSKKTSYGFSPLDMAKRFEDAGITHLHLVDLDGAKGGKPENLPVLESIRKNTHLEIDFGGGIKSMASACDAFNAGASYISCGSLAVKKPEEMMKLVEKFQEKIILSADCRDGMIAVQGWLEKTDLPVVEFIQEYWKKGIRRAVVTDIAKDGMLSGPSVSLYRTILQEIPELELVASGGVTSVQDLSELRQAKCFAAIIGKAYYEGYLTLQDLKESEHAC